MWNENYQRYRLVVDSWHKAKFLEQVDDRYNIKAGISGGPSISSQTQKS